MSQFKEVLSSGGLYYTTLYAVRWVWQRVLAWLDRRLVSVEQRKGLTHAWAISARRYTAADKIVTQSQKLVNPGDVLTILKLPA